MNKRKIFALLVTIFFLILIFYKLDVSELISTFKVFDFKNLWLIIILYILSMYIRGFRWKALFLDDKKYSALELSENFVTGIFLNIFLPARGGDLYRAYQLGATKDEKKMKVLGSILIERTFDGICVFLILLFAVVMYCKTKWIINLSYTVGTLFIGSFVSFYLIYKYNKLDFIFGKIKNLAIKILPQKYHEKISNIFEFINSQLNNFVEGFKALNSFKYTFKAFLFSALAWGIECVVAYLIINSFHMQIGFAASLFVISLISFSTMIPSASSFVGPYQYAYILALGIFGIDKSTTLGISTIHQSILLLTQGLMCSYIVLKNNFFGKK